MPKKIRIVDDEAPDDEMMDNADFNQKVLDLAHTMDWKLWESLQALQRMEATMDKAVTLLSKIELVEDEDDGPSKPSRVKRNTTSKK